MRRKATFDSSFWVHVVYLDLIEFLLEDYELFCTPAVENELGRANPTGLKLRALLHDNRIRPARARSERVKLFGKGERAAINLALEQKLLLLIDDWRPYQRAIQHGIEVVNSPVYLVGLYEQGRIRTDRVLDALGKMTRRGTVKQEWILGALKMVSLIRERKIGKGEEG